MKTQTETRVTFTLVLNQDEAMWLKGIMQNPIGAFDVSQESDLDKEMRRKFWHALNIDQQKSNLQ